MAAAGFRRDPGLNFRPGRSVSEAKPETKGMTMSGGIIAARRTLMVSAAAAALTMALASAAQAAAAADARPAASSVEEIIVTAERRNEDIQRTPDAITEVPAKALDQQFITRITGLNAQVPSLEITKASGFENLVAIRGIGSETPENSLSTLPGVSEFVDGVYISNSISLDQTLFDVHDIEVLRGPQGALYGQSSTGGAILINTNQPRLGVWDASGDVSFGNYNLFRERLEVNIPLGDKLALRLSGQKFDHAGFTDDLAIPGFREDDAHDGSVKAALLFQPSSDFSATLTAMYYESNQNGDAQKNINDPEPSPWQIYQDYPSHFALKSSLVHLNVEWDGPGFIVKSVTAYQGLDHVQQEDSTRSAYSLLGIYDDVAAWNTHVHNYTEEFDILSKPGGKVDWVVGAFGLYQSGKQYVLEYECTSGCTAPPTSAMLSPSGAVEGENPLPGNLDYGNDSHSHHRSGSVFGQATWHVTDTFRVTGGVRGNWDHFEGNSYNFSAFGTGSVLVTRSDATPTWRLETDWDATPNNMLYASYSRGYKPGGVNGKDAQVFSGIEVIPATFVPEHNDAFEVGSKNWFLDHTIRLNAAAFYYIQKNFQYIEYSPHPFGSGISNIPEVHDYGVEIETNYVSTDSRLRIDGTLALERGRVATSYKSIDSTVANAIENPAPTNFSSPCAFGGAYYNPACWDAVVASAIDLKGARPPNMPEVSGAISASYRFDLFGGVLTPRVQYIYRGSEWARIFNDPTLDRVPAYGVVNLNLEYQPHDSKLRVDLTATNIGNVAGVNSRYTDPYGSGQTSQQFISPFQIIGTVAYSF
ncbi:MAG TPA: TonB-dependent receptor [Caulobacteraceae bacterium]|jgi:iron complex outermembrane receptor protein|nr:TonB-dependent receptor [Caulobacteraceae bacterium]